MKVAIYSYIDKQFRNHKDSWAVDHQRIQLVLAFGAKQILAEDRMYNRIRHQFPIADIVLCSTAGFYGSRLRIAHGSLGGWEMFGPEKTVTRSNGNQLYEVNGESALDIYKKYLGPYADGLPGSALLFPLSVTLSPERGPVVRTILSIDPQSKSMIFAGDVPEGSKVRFMKANFDKLIDAASMAAHQTCGAVRGPNPQFALLISCVGRKVILESRIEEEVMAVQEVMGDRTLMTGFYSYGEISPFLENTGCELHNQTMTITTFDEK